MVRTVYPKRVSRDSGWIDIRLYELISAQPSGFPGRQGLREDGTGRKLPLASKVTPSGTTFKGEHVRTVYRKGAARHLLCTV